MNCSIPTCSEKACFECICNNTRKNYCKTHLTHHIINDPPPHSNRQLEQSINQEVIKVVLTSLEDLKKSVPTFKRQLIEDFSRIISSLEEKSRTVLRSLDDYSMNLNKIIIDIKKNPNNIQDSRIKQTLFAGLNEAKSEVASWNVFNFSLNSFSVNESIKGWAQIEEDFNYLFTQSPRKVLSKNAGQPAVNLSSPESLSNRDVLNGNSNDRANFARSQSLSSAGSSRNSVGNGKLFCSKNHELKWSTLVPFTYFRIAKNFTITCDSCKSEFSTSCWHCDQCNYDNCESCGQRQGAVAPKLKCLSNHELLWRPDAPFYYQLKGQGHNFKCKSCNLIKSEPCWHCHDCDYDICASCSESKFGQNRFSSSAKCKNGHNLIEKNLPALNINGLLVLPKCDCCSKNFSGNGKVCHTCSYYLCSECTEFFNYPSPGHPAFRCQSAHLLRWTPIENFQCDSCYNKMQQEHYKCKECNFDLCFNCSNVLMKCIVKSDKKTHGNAGHPLTWKWNAGNGRPNGATPCNLCGLNYKTGMYSCSLCPNNYCLLCYNDPNRPKPQINRGQGNMNDLLAMQMLFGSLLNR